MVIRIRRLRRSTRHRRTAGSGCPKRSRIWGRQPVHISGAEWIVVSGGGGDSRTESLELPWTTRFFTVPRKDRHGSSSKCNSRRVAKRGKAGMTHVTLKIYSGTVFSIAKPIGNRGPVKSIEPNSQDKLLNEKNTIQPT